jgi:hypothetical protein
MAEARDVVGPLAHSTDERGQFRPQTGHLDRLIDERAFEAKRGRLHREALARAPHAHPVIGIGAGSDENGDAWGRVELESIALVLSLRRDREVEK